MTKKVFSYNEDIAKCAFMNWRVNNHEPIQNMNVLAEGYFESALLLAKSCLEDNRDKRADTIVFPMLFAVNHGIELYVKSICWSMNILLGYKGSYTENHDIRGIWYTAKQKIREFGFGYGREETEFNSMIINLEKYLDELSNTIRMNANINDAYHNIDFSRYPINNRKDYHFYLNRYDNVVIDLENFVILFEDIYECLHRLSGYYYDMVVDSWQTEDL